MAEAVAAIGLAASIASLVDISVKVVARLNEFTTQVSDVPESFRSLADRLPVLVHALQRIKAQAQRDRIQVNKTKDLNRLVDGIIEQVNYIERCLSRIVPVAGDTRLERTLKAFKSLAKEEKVNQALQKVQGGIDVLVLYQTSDNADATDRILEELSRLNLTGESTPRTFGLCLGQAPQIESEAFIGREEELQQLRTLLATDNITKTQKIASIVGMGGLGKTQLSLAYARANAGQYSSIFWLNAKDESSLRQSISNMATIISPSNDNAAADSNDGGSRVKQVRNWLSESWNNEWLIIFDNYDDPNLPNVRSQTGFDIREYFPFRAQGQILITTRCPKLTFSKRLMLQKLDDIDQGIDVLSQRSGQNLEEDKDARRLAVRLDGLPLALATAGTYLGQTSLSCGEYLEAYESAWIDLHGPGSEELLEYADRTLSSTWAISFNQVQHQDPEAAELLKFFAFLSHQDVWFELLQGGIPRGPSWLAKVATNRIRFERAITKLRDYSLVESLPNSYSIHPCLHDWIFEQFNAVRDELSFVAALRCVSENILQEDDPRYWPLIRRLLKHINRLQSPLFQQLWDNGKSAPFVIDAGGAFAGVYSDLGYPLEAEKAYKRSLASHEEYYGLDHVRTLDILNNLGILYRDESRLDEAESVYTRALAGFDSKLGPGHPESFDTLHNLCILYIVQKRLEEAEQTCLKTLAAHERHFGPDHYRTLQVVKIMGNLYITKHDFEKSEQMYTRALVGFEKTSGPDDLSLLVVQEQLGSLYYWQDRHAEALPLLLRAVEGQERVCGLFHRFTLSTISVLHCLYKETGDLDKVAELDQRVASHGYVDDDGEFVTWDSRKAT